MESTKIIQIDTNAENFYLVDISTNVPLRLFNGAKIGRTEGDFVFKDDSTISSSHLEIVLLGSEIYLIDLGSSNGTFVNNIKLEANKQIKVEVGSKIRLGNREFILSENHQAPAPLSTKKPTLYRSAILGLKHLFKINQYSLGEAVFVAFLGLVAVGVFDEAFVDTLPSYDIHSSLAMKSVILGEFFSICFLYWFSYFTFKSYFLGTPKGKSGPKGLLIGIMAFVFAVSVVEFGLGFGDSFNPDKMAYENKIEHYCKSNGSYKNCRRLSKSLFFRKLKKEKRVQYREYLRNHPDYKKPKTVIQN